MQIHLEDASIQRNLEARQSHQEEVENEEEGEQRVVRK